MSVLTALFCRLPYPLRVVAASLHGYRLGRWRRGPETPALVEEALERESWNTARWRLWQEERLALLLDRAARRVPYYRELWRRRGGPREWERLENWPVLEKADLRADPRAFVADDRDVRRMYRVFTSGTTGTPLEIWSSRTTVRRWYAICEARLQRWNGVGPETRWAILGGRLITPVSRRDPPHWVWNAGLRQLYMSAYHIAAASTAAYLDAMHRHRVAYLLGYPSAMFALARLCAEQRLDAPRLKVVLSNAEPLPAWQREVIEEVFRCPVRDSYGMAEAVLGASECEAGRMHLWPESGVAETVSGRLICTGLINADMPLIRYAVGDRATLARGGEICRCGRGLPLLGRIEGRQDDVLVTRDGRLVGRLDPVFKGRLPIEEAQIIQESLDRIRVRVVAADGYGHATRASIRRGVRDRLGDVEVVVEDVDAIPRGPNGKFRAVVSKVSSDPPSARA